MLQLMHKGVKILAWTKLLSLILNLSPKVNLCWMLQLMHWESKNSGLDEAVVSDPESELKSQFVLDSAVDAQGSKNSGLDEAVVSDPESQLKSQFVLDSAVDAQGSKNSGSG
ncbi:chromatin structure-remodeling complex protein SYD-like [Abeliophyllum distichum]|uniref:Chromatin structure-remodeling complex protein SYD-like n=1 Tax=Abeliophyllum distichum TaxID=126358 RepID=A0ABD1RC45_9LAMI